MTRDLRLDSDIEPERQRLADVTGQDPTNQDILGYGVIYTVGAEFNVLVPRDWLLETMDELGIPQWLAPSEVRPHYAYDRAIKRMKQSWIDDYSVRLPRWDNPDTSDYHRVTVDLKEGDGQRVWHVRAEVFYPEEESLEEGGVWERHDLGQIHYSSSYESVMLERNDNLPDDSPLYEVWKDVANTAISMHDEMMELHVAHDIRMIMYGAIRDYTNSVIKLRRSVYLFPAGMGEFVDSMAELYNRINENFKLTGEPVAIRTFEVLDTAEKREWIEHQVREELEEHIESVVQEGLERFDEGEAASEVVKIIRDRLSGTDETAELYNTLLEAEIQIEESLERMKLQVGEDDKRDIVEKVMR